MPEIVDLIYISDKLQTSLGLPDEPPTVKEVQVHEPILIRSLTGEKIAEVLPGTKLLQLKRVGPFLHLRFDNGIHLVIHLMLAGRVALEDTPLKKTAKNGAALSLILQGRGSLNLKDTKRMAKIYVSHDKELASIPKFNNLGPDIYTDDFTWDYFWTSLKKSRTQILVFLKDDSKINTLGSAYGDEVLFAAGIHPKTRCNKIDETSARKLFDEIFTVLKTALDYIYERGETTDVKIRDHVKVRNRKNEPCPVCGTKIRRASVHGYDTFFCPKCQPDTSKGLDWQQLNP